MKNSIRLCTQKDIILINNLVNKAYRGDSSRKGWTTEANLLDGQRIDSHMLQEIFESRNQRLFVCENELNQVIGCVQLSLIPEFKAYFGMLTVDPDIQNQGLGRKLLSFAETWAKDNWHTRTMQMRVLPQRKELIAWYMRQGYQPTNDYVSFPQDPKFGIPKVNDLQLHLYEKQI